MKTRKIIIVEYNSKWTEQYSREIELVNKTLSKEIIKAHHIGSTSVPNLVAKPVIDILLEVKDVNSLDKFNTEMEKNDYIPKGEFGIPNRRFYLNPSLLV